jgi:hypothetical protein
MELNVLANEPTTPHLILWRLCGHN